MNDWAVLYSSRAYTRAGLIHWASCEICNVMPTTNFMNRKNCTDLKQNHYNVFQSACAVISRFFDITSLNGGLHEGVIRGQNTKHGSKNYPRSLKCYFSLEMPNTGIEKLLFLKGDIEKRYYIFQKKYGYDCFCSVYV